MLAWVSDYNVSSTRPGVGKLRPATIFCAGRESLNRTMNYLLKFHKIKLVTFCND